MNPKKVKYGLLSVFLALSIKNYSEERLIIVNEGMWQTDNGRLTYFEDGEIISNEWFRDINGTKLGDTPNDIIQVNDNLIAIALNWSNIIQFINTEGEAIAATEDIPNNRKLASDGSFVYATSYGHETVVNGQTKKFEKGFVAKIDISSFHVTDACEVGYEPEGIAFYKGYLFIANTGGYAFQENHDYESTVSVVEANTMKIVRTIDTGHINLYGKMSQSGKYLCINSTGDYYSTNSATIIMDCDAVLQGLPNNQCFRTIDFSSSYNSTDIDGNFIIIGSSFSFLTGEYKFTYFKIFPEEFIESEGVEGLEENLPGSIADDFTKMSMPYGVYVNPYTGYIYGTDAGQYTGAGSLYQWSPEGELIGVYKTYINPAHFLALPPTDQTEKDPENQEENPLPDNNLQDNTDDYPSIDKDSNDKDDPDQEKPGEKLPDDDNQYPEKDNNEKPNDTKPDTNTSESPGNDDEKPGNGSSLENSGQTGTPDKDTEEPSADQGGTVDNNHSVSDNKEPNEDQPSIEDKEGEDKETDETGNGEIDSSKPGEDNNTDFDEEIDPGFSHPSDEENNAVDCIEIEELDATPYYDLNGHKVLHPSYGKIYIHKGKKIIFKPFNQ